MSRPIYEPTPARYDAYNDFGNQQLFRRPAQPTGASPIQIFRAMCFFHVETVPSGGSQRTIDFDIWNYCDTSVFCPLDQGLNPNPTPGIDLVPRIRLGDCGTTPSDTVPGTYDIYLAVVPDSMFTGTVELAMHDGDDTFGFSDNYYHATNSVFGNAFISAMWSKVYPLWDPTGSEISVAELSFTIAQVNGTATSHDFNPIWMEIHFNPNINDCPESAS